MIWSGDDLVGADLAGADLAGADMEGLFHHAALLGSQEHMAEANSCLLLLSSHSNAKCK